MTINPHDISIALTESKTTSINKNTIAKIAQMQPVIHRAEAMPMLYLPSFGALLKDQ